MRGRCWGRLSSRRSHLPSPVSMPIPCPGSPSELSPACSSAHPMDRGLRPYPGRPSAALLGFAQSLLSLTCSSSPHLSCFSCFLRSPAFCSRPPSPSFLLCPQLTAVPARSPNSTTPAHCTVGKARSSGSLRCPTSRLGPRTFWWLQMWLVVVLISKMCPWLSTMIWPKILKVSASEGGFISG